MEPSRPSRLQRHVTRRRSAVRPTFGVVAGVGVAAGLFAPWVMDLTAYDDISGLVRLALLAPAVLFLAWWVAVPGVSPERDLAGAWPAPGEVEARIERM